jgi:hypothetical protein
MASAWAVGRSGILKWNSFGIINHLFRPILRSVSRSFSRISFLPLARYFRLRTTFVPGLFRPKLNQSQTENSRWQAHACGRPTLIMEVYSE